MSLFKWLDFQSSYSLSGVNLCSFPAEYLKNQLQISEPAITGSSLMIKLSDRLDQNISEVFQFHETLINNKRRVQLLKTNCCICFCFLPFMVEGKYCEKKSTWAEKDCMETIVAWFVIWIHVTKIIIRGRSNLCIKHNVRLWDWYLLFHLLLQPSPLKKTPNNYMN